MGFEDPPAEKFLECLISTWSSWQTNIDQSHLHKITAAFHRCIRGETAGRHLGVL